MKNLFHKSRVPEIASMYQRDGRAFWSLTRAIQDEDSFSRQPDKEEFLLQKGAYAGDACSMTELARYIYRKNDSSLPQALSWWFKAACAKDSYALEDLDRLPIEARILSYRTGASKYADLEVQFALLTEWVLTDLGRTPWDRLSLREKENRCRTLMVKCADLLGLMPPKVVYEEIPGKKVPSLGYLCDGLACFNTHCITIRRALLVPNRYERLIHVLFHELGHLAVYSTYLGPEEKWDRQRKLLGIGPERVEAYKRRDVGPEGPVTEEDPDTLGYGVWTNWRIYFGK